MFDDTVAGNLDSDETLWILQSQTGWWYTYPSEKSELVNWDDDIPNIWKNKNYVPNHRPAMIYLWFMGDISWYIKIFPIFLAPNMVFPPGISVTGRLGGPAMGA